MPRSSNPFKQFGTLPKAPKLPKQTVPGPKPIGPGTFGPIVAPKPAALAPLGPISAPRTKLPKMPKITRKPPKPVKLAPPSYL